MPGIYWNGADGNVYVKQAGQVGVKSFGTPDQLAANAKISGFNVLNGLTLDNSLNHAPAAPQTTQQNNSNTSGNNTISANTASAAPAVVYPDKSNEIAFNQKGLGTADSQTQAGIDAINTAVGKLKGSYATETAANEGNYKNESDSNMNTYQGGKQTSLVNAAQGRHGLLGTLASIGALSNDSIELANEAVQNGANTDLHGVATTFGNNQSGLDTAIGTYRREDKARNDTADTEAENSRKAETARGAASKQTFLTNIGNDYQLEGKAAEARPYFDQASALYPTIAANNVPSGNLTPQQAAYATPAMSTYLGANNTAVQTTPANGAPGSLPGLSALSGKKQQSSLVIA